MNRLSKEKRNQLFLAVVVILLVVAGLYFGLIRVQQQKIRDLSVEQQSVRKKLNEISETTKRSATIESDLASIRTEIQLREENMASDDLYASMINSIRAFKTSHNVDIKQFNSKGMSEMSLRAKFPYKQFTVSVIGSAYYHDLGKFIADFENRFRTSRIANLEITPESSQNAAEREKLTFKMDIVSLIKPSESPVDKKP